jgi:hypothetical protein
LTRAPVSAVDDAAADLMGARRLMAAVLDDALSLIDAVASAGGFAHVPRLARRRAREALAWINDHEARGLFSFEGICAALDLDADAVAAEVAEKLNPDPQRRRQARDARRDRASARS